MLIPQPPHSLGQSAESEIELHFGLAVKSQNATLYLKRKLACEQLSFYAQIKAYFCLSEMKEMKESCATLKQQLFFLKWKHLEAKAAGYYYHSLILDKGTEPSSHVSTICCSLVAEEPLAESKKVFCLADPVTRCPPLWGAMKLLHKTIPETAFKKAQMYAELYIWSSKDMS